MLVFPIFFGSPYSNLSIAAAALAGAIVGMPVVLFGAKMSKSTCHDKVEKSPFFPPRADLIKFLWGSLLYISLMVLVAVPFLLLIPLKWIPAGDDWSLVIGRLLVILTFLVIGRWWIRPASHILRRMFTGKVAHQFLSDVIDSSPVEKYELMTSARKNWGVLLLAAVAILVAFRVIGFNDPWLILDVKPGGRPGHGRWTRLIRDVPVLFEWFRNNPNMTRASSFVLGLGTLGIFVDRIQFARGISR